MDEERRINAEMDAEEELMRAQARDEAEQAADNVAEYQRDAQENPEPTNLEEE